MLQRPPSCRDRRRDRQARYRQRARNGVAVAPVEFDGEVVEFLVRTDWLDPADVGDVRKVGAAISRSMHDAASRG
jgi:hypothetical protein